MPIFLQPFVRYADFTGRSRRSEYWLFRLVTIVAYIALFLIAEALRSYNSFLYILPMMLFFVLALASIVPSLAVGFRRLHDSDRSAWWILIAFVPILGPLVLLAFLCIDGTPGDNRFGPDPKGRGAPSPGLAPA